MKHLSKAKQQVILDAKEAGYAIKEKAGGEVIEIYKTHSNSSRVTAGITIWADGKATRMDVRNDLALAIRSADSMREVLGLNQNPPRP